MHIDVDPSVISANYKTAHALVGDARLVLEGLLAQLQEQRGKRVKTEFDGKAVVARARTVKYEAFQKLANEIACGRSGPSACSPNCTACCRAMRSSWPIPGTPCPYVSGYYEMLEAGRHFITNRAHGALGYSMSAAMGAWFAQPQKKCVSLMGDGSFGFSVGELETVVRHKVPLLDDRVFECGLRLDQGEPESQLRTSAISRWISIAPIMRSSRRAMASSRGKWKIPSRSARCCARPLNMTVPRWWM